jgi:hypothetical protein
VADKIRARLDRADAEVEMRADRLSSQMDDVLGQDRLEGQLAERRRRLGMVEETDIAAEEDEEEEASSLDY